MYSPGQILTKNGKTGSSIDFPIQGHCSPTKNCHKHCYARFGNQSRPNCLRKQQWVSNYLLGDDISRLIVESKYRRSIRLCGAGDLLPGHIPNLLRLAEEAPQTEFWGMTRKTDIAGQVNGRLQNLRLLVSVDSSSPESVWNYQGKMCWGPRLPEDQVPEDDRILVVFPRHHGGKVIKAVPEHPKDCQAVYHRIEGCIECGRCWKW